VKVKEDCEGGGGDGRARMKDDSDKEQRRLWSEWREGEKERRISFVVGLEGLFFPSMVLVEALATPKQKKVTNSLSMRTRGTRGRVALLSSSDVFGPFQLPRHRRS
jgi:hypothetical protein